MKLNLSFGLQHLGKGVSSSLTEGYNDFKRSEAGGGDIF